MTKLDKLYEVDPKQLPKATSSLPGTSQGKRSRPNTVPHAVAH